MSKGICPVCNGTKRVPCQTPKETSWLKMSVGYNKEDHTSRCCNCGGQTMSCTPTGEVPLNYEGVPCTHEYTYTKLGNCYHGYICNLCGHKYKIDSGG